MKALEIGCGTELTREPGWEHLDARDLPHVEHVQDARDLSNFADGSFDLVVAKDVIEHLPWRDVEPALAEWLRVVTFGGHLEVETPNAAELVELITNPGDPLLRRWGAESDWERFSRVAYGHQDYLENFHGCYFTPAWLEELLVKAGASAVEQVHCDLYRFRLRATK